MTARLSVVRQPRNATAGRPKTPEKAIRKIDMDVDLTMLIGPVRNGTPLEIGVLDLNGEDPVVIHAMRLRAKFYPLIRQRVIS